MPIIRAPRPERNFYMLDKTISEDKRLTWAARGLLVFLLGKPDHWRVSVQALINETKGAAKATGRDGVYAVLKELIETSYITREKHANGTVDYLVKEPNPENPYVGIDPNPEKPDTEKPDTEKPDVLVSTDKAVRIEEAAKSQNAPKPLPSRAAKTRSAEKLQVFIERCKEQGKGVVACEDPIFAYIDSVGLTDRMLEIAWFCFKARFLQSDKTQKDWRAHFRNAVKGNWFRLWFFAADGSARLTTAGEQAFRELTASQRGEHG